MIYEMLRSILWAAIGAGAGYYVAKKHLEADYETRLRTDLEQTRRFYKNMYDEKLRRETEKIREQVEVLEEAVAEVTDVQEEEVHKALERVLTLTSGTSADIPEQADEPEAEAEEMPEEAVKALVNYQGISASSEPVGNVSRVLERGMVEQKSEQLTYVKPDGPRLIDFEKFAENGGDYEQHTVVYYEVDSEVSDENEEKLDKKYVGTHISYANLAKLNEQNTTIWVRDDKHRKDHEVIWSRGSYAVDVLGQQPE
ncbi:hypothetical protein SscP1EGY_25 [Streptomyces phage SscP1EGY]|nr:hypothetical protein SscP1EGY_25 [Streptomyces phage SscP1EGY]